MRMVRLCAVLLLAETLALTMSANAQEVTPPSKPIPRINELKTPQFGAGWLAQVPNPKDIAQGTSPNSADLLDEVTVQGLRGYHPSKSSTATGTNTSILETPFSVQVIPQEVIRDQQAISIQEVVSNVSSVTYFGNTGGREANFNIRGFGNPLGASAPVLRDGYRLYGSFQAIPELANLQQVEVLKGPSSILYGQTEPGGIINLVSKQPLAKPFFEAEVQAGSRELVRPRIDLGGPLTADGNLLYRLNASYKHESSFRNFVTDSNRFSVAPILRWKIDERTDLSFNLEYTYNRGPADFGITQFRDGVAPVAREFVVNNPDDSVTTDYLSLGYSFEHRFDDNWKIRNGFRYISYNYDYGVVALPLIVQDETVTRFYADQDGQDRSYSLFTNVVGNFTTGTIKHTLLAGVDLNRSESRIISLLDFANPSPLNIFNPDYVLVPKPSRSALSLFNDTLTTNNQLGIYLQDQIYLLDNLILAPGLRYDSVTQRATNTPTPFTEGGVSERTSDALTPRLGLLYRPLPELSLFTNYSRSFNPTTSIGENGVPLEVERGEGFEFGVKSKLFNQKLLATLTYFDITKQNVAVVDPQNPLFTISVGEQKSQGVELDIAGEILPGWKVIGSYSYIDAKVTKDTTLENIGNPLFGVPKNKASLWTSYTLQQGELQGLGFGIGLEYLGNRFGDLANSYQVGDYLIGNASVSYRRDKYRLAVNIRNISNAKYIESVTGNNGGIYPGAPLTVIFSLSSEF
ncbi:MAG: TonB-dependent siderophore receptor [Anaerolineae bacterium]|nr:TonB-dependent siderophore receptor [Gloeobacterales cyanobacterium ES-bin-313]